MSSNISGADVEQTYELLIECMMQAKHRLALLAADFNITAMQAMLLLLLDEPSPMNNFTKVFNCDPSNITGIVDGLEQRNLAARFPDKNDRRIKMVKLSPSGEQLRQNLIKLLVEDQKSSLFKFDPSELATFNRLLRKITS
jgi:DNA-binding MarR family transcriptional regulator